MSASTTFEIGDLEYEITAAGFYPPSYDPSTGQGDNAEVTPSALVRVTHFREMPNDALPSGVGYLKVLEDWTTYPVFLLELALEKGITVNLADTVACEQLLADAMDKWEDSKNDGPEWERDE